MEPFPATFDVDYAGGERNRLLGAAGIIPYIKQFFLIPHFIVLFFLGIGAFFGAWIGYFMILFTGQRQPEGLHKFISGTIGWSSRTNAWQYSLVDEYPPFELHPAGAYPAVWSETDDTPGRNRLLALAGIFGIKFLMALPHLIVLAFVGFGAFVAAWFGYWIILFTGSLPEGIHTFVTGFQRWAARVGAWLLSLTDTYPPFSLD